MAINKQKIPADREAKILKEASKAKSIKENLKTFSVEDFKENLEVKTLKDVKFSNVDKKRAVKASEKPGVLSLIYSTRNGKRYQFSNALYKKIGEPSTIQIGFTDTSILVSEKLSDVADDLEVRFSQNRPVIYSASLVEDAIIKFELVYEDGCVSKTFNEVEYYKDGSTDTIVAEIKIITETGTDEKEDENNEA